MGGNPAENHPVGFKWFMEARRTRNAKLVAVDPRFTRTAAVADLYAPIRPGTDIAFLLGMIRYAIEKKRFTRTTSSSTPTSDHHRRKIHLRGRAVSGFDAAKRNTSRPAGTTRPTRDHGYEVDPSWRIPAACSAAKKHVDRYTPEMVERICGTRRDFPQVAEAGDLDRKRAAVWDHHLRARLDPALDRRADDPRRGHVQLLLGNVGRPGGGVNAFRRPLEYPGRHRHGGHLRDLARLSQDRPSAPRHPCPSKWRTRSRPRSTSRPGPP